MSSAAREPELPAVLRPIRPDDVLECIDVFHAALDALYGRFNQPPVPREPAGLQRLIQHLIDRDGDRAWLAEEPSTTADRAAPRVLGFGAASLREPHWFLSLLFVRPEAQAGGLGRRLLRQTFPRAAAAPEGHPVPGYDAARRQTPGVGAMSTCVDALQPVSTGLYAAYGIVPRVPLFSAVGDPRPARFPALPPGVQTLPFDALAADRLAADLAAIDQTVLGYARPADHAFWRSEARHGLLFRDAGARAPLGYGYTQASGRLGPVALLDPFLTAAALGALFTRETPRGPWLALVPGSNDRAMVALLRSGFRFEGWPGIVASTRAVDYLSRYLPASFALL